MPINVPAIQQATWDTGVCWSMRWGVTKIPLMKFTAPTFEIKVEKPRRLGEMIGEVSTPGVAEVSNADCEMLLTDYSAVILPRMPAHGGTLIHFVVSKDIRHPTIQGSYSALYDGARIISHGGPDGSGDEKGAIKKLGLMLINAYEKGADGQWKCLAQMSRRPSAELRALMKF